MEKQDSRKKNNFGKTSCRGLWRQLVTPEEQETHIHNLRILTLADFEEYQSKFAEKIQLRIYELYQQSKHERTLQAEKEVSDLQQSISQLQLQRATELDEVTSTKNCESMTRTPIDKNTRKPFASLSKDDLIHMVLEAQSTIEKLSMSEKVQANFPIEQIEKNYNWVMSQNPKSKHDFLYIDLNCKPCHPSSLRYNYNDFILQD
jgi:hypothetical protein